MSEIYKTENQNTGLLFYLLAALQILQAVCGAILSLLIAPASLFVSRSENEAFGWIVAGFIGLAVLALALVLIPLSLIAAIGFRGEKRWRKITGFIAACLAILEFPLGTLLSIFLFRKVLSD